MHTAVALNIAKYTAVSARLEHPTTDSWHYGVHSYCLYGRENSHKGGERGSTGFWLCHYIVYVIPHFVTVVY